MYNNNQKKGVFKMKKLIDEVKRIIENQGSKEEQKTFMQDVMNYGCQSGVVSELIYSNDTIEFFEKFKNEINELLYEMIEETGLSVNELFGDKWDETDPLAYNISNKNLLAWLAFEEVTRSIYEGLYGSY